MSGRPSKYNQEIADEICYRLSTGQTMRSICDAPNMPDYSNLWRWINNNEEFRTQSMYARELGTHALADECIQIADDPMLDPQDKRIRIDTRIRLIGKWNSKKYGDKIELESNNNNNIVLSFTVPDRNENKDIIELESPEKITLEDKKDGQKH